MIEFLKANLIAVIALLVLTAGVGVGVYTVQTRTQLFSQASTTTGLPKGYLVKPECGGEWQVYGWSCDPDPYSLGKHRGMAIYLHADGTRYQYISPTNTRKTFPNAAMSAEVAAQCGGIAAQWFNEPFPENLRGRTVRIEAFAGDQNSDGFETGQLFQLLNTSNNQPTAYEVNCPVLPKATITLSPNPVPYNGSLTISYTTSGIPAGTTCNQNWNTLNGNPLPINTSGTATVGNQRNANTFTISCTNGTTASATSQVGAAPVDATFSGWSGCTNACGTEGNETRTCTAEGSNGGRTCAQGPADGAGLTRACPVVACPCTPEQPQTQTSACPAGQTGTITMSRTSQCPGPTWTAWQEVSRTCQTVAPSNNKPTITGGTIAPASVTANGSTQYTITLTATDADGAADIGHMLGLLNYLNNAEDQRRGYLGWTSINFDQWWGGNNQAKNLLQCTGGGFGGIYNGSGGGGYGKDYMNLVSCATATSGNTRTATFVVTFNTNFTAPQNNRIDAFASDKAFEYDGWKEFGTFTLASTQQQCTQGTFADASILEGQNCGTIVSKPASGATTGVIKYTAPNVSHSEVVCNLKATTVNNGNCTLNAGGKGASSTPLQPGETIDIQYSNQCTSAAQGCSLALHVRPGDPIEQESDFTYKIAETEAGLTNAIAKSFNGNAESFNATHVLEDIEPGTKQLWVEFKNNITGQVVRDSINVEMLSDGPELLGVNCSTPLANGDLVVDINGKNLGNGDGQAGISVNGNTISKNTWEKDYIKGSLNKPTPVASDGAIYDIEVTTADGKKLPKVQCTVGRSMISLGTKLFCRGDGLYAVKGAKVLLIDEDGNKVEEIVDIGNDGMITGLKSQLYDGKNYVISVKGTRLIRKNITFKAQRGTSVLTNSKGEVVVLPVGDIAPRPDGDGVVNTLDRSFLIAQWRNAVAATQPLTADFNSDNRVNSFDWACMRREYGQRDDEIPDRAPRSLSENITQAPSSPPSPTPSSSSPSPSPTSPVTDGANLIKNGSFENPVIANTVTTNLWQVYGYPTGNVNGFTTENIPDWSPRQTNAPYQVELHKNLYGQAKDGSQYAEIDAEGIQTMKQTIPTTARSYQLKFAYSPRRDAGEQKLGVYWNGQLVDTITATGAGGTNNVIIWQDKTYTVQGINGNSTLGFGSIKASGAGNFIDAISVTPGVTNSSPSPTPNLSTPQARDTKRKSDLIALKNALKAFFNATGTYPVKEPGTMYDYMTSENSGRWLVGLPESNINPMPVDPLNNAKIDINSSTVQNQYSYWYWAGVTAGTWGGNCANYQKGKYFALAARLENPDDPENLKSKNHTWCDSGNLITSHGWDPRLYVITSEMP
jgi:hypothetical protein